MVPSGAPRCVRPADSATDVGSVLAAGVEIAAAVIIGLAAVEAVWRALPLFLRRGLRQKVKVDARPSLGRWLALGLEFALAADILRTAVAPTWRDIGQPAAISPCSVPA